MLLGLGAWPILASVGPRLEGYLFPVMSEATIERYLPDGDEWTLIHGSFEKYRNCKFIGLEWSLKQGSGPSVIVPVEFLSGTRARGAGEQEFGPWKLTVRPESIEGMTYAHAYHQCHWFWRTRTRFWGKP